MNGVEVELVVGAIVGLFALAFLRDAWRTLRGGTRGPTAHWVHASRSVRFGGRRACGSEL